jgi:hypothetical protein
VELKLRATHNFCHHDEIESNVSQSNIDKMLELIEESHPCGIDEWDLIAASFNSHFGNGENRSGEDLRNKLKALKNVRKPSGDPDIPPNVLRAKLAQKEIEARCGRKDPWTWT